MTGQDRRHLAAFTLLQRLYPADFRRRFGADQCDLFRDQLREIRHRRGGPGVALYWARVVPSMLRSALAEHVDSLRDRPARALSADLHPLRDSMLHSVLADLRFSLRMLRRSPVFTVVSVVIIALGSGAVTTTWSALRALVMRPVPGATQGERLAGLSLRNTENGREMTMTRTAMERLQVRNRTLTGLAGWNRSNATVQSDAGSVAVSSVQVTGGYFQVLGARAALGRVLTPEDDATVGARPVAVLSHLFWQTQFAGDPAVIGQTIRINRVALTVVGVMGPDFRGAMPIVSDDVYVPTAMTTVLFGTRPAGTPEYVRPIGRLRDGVTFDDATRDLTSILASVAADPDERPEDRRRNSATATMLRAVPEDARGPFQGFLSILVGGAALVLLIASVNVASMLSARAVARAREMNVRRALGAGRWRLIRQLLIETLVLFAMGTAGGVGLAFMATNALEAVRLPVDRSPVIEITPDGRALLVSLGVSLFTALVFGLAPALQGAGRDVATRLRDNSAGAGQRRGIGGRLLIVGQLAASLVLLVSAGLFVRVLDEARRTHPGFATDGIVAASLLPGSWGYSPDRISSVLSTVKERAGTLAGVSDVAFADRLPMTAATSQASIEVPGHERVRADGSVGGIEVSTAQVGDGYFRTLQQPMLEGREFSVGDLSGDAPVVIVNQTLARQLWPDGSALGRSFRIAGRAVTVIGVAGDARYNTVADAVPPVFYSPLNATSNRFLVVRTAAPPAQAIGDLRGLMRSIDGDLPMPVITTLQQATAVGLFPQRVAAAATALMGGVGLLMAAVGLYGVIAYSVGRRTRELGVRMALGATRRDILLLTAREGTQLALAGTIVGLLLAAVITRFLQKLLYEVSPMDAVTFAVTATGLLGVALLATWLPARRAAANSPMQALRTDG